MGRSKTVDKQEIREYLLLASGIAVVGFGLFALMIMQHLYPYNVVHYGILGLYLGVLLIINWVSLYILTPVTDPSCNKEEVLFWIKLKVIFEIVMSSCYFLIVIEYLQGAIIL